MDGRNERVAGRRPFPTSRLPSLVMAAVITIALGSCMAPGDDAAGSPSPLAGASSPASTPTSSPAPDATSEPEEPLRPSAADIAGDDPADPPWTDPRDQSIAAGDIVAVERAVDMRGGSSWRFRLAARAPREPVSRVVGYGVAVDRDGDRVADCQIGINSDGPEPGDFHVWVTNLHSHETAVQDGPPYGYPVEFAHPAENEEPTPTMSIGFLGGLGQPGPCEAFDASSTFYAWASVTEGGKPLARDFAPDAGWLPIGFAD